MQSNLNVLRTKREQITVEIRKKNRDNLFK